MSASIRLAAFRQLGHPNLDHPEARSAFYGGTARANPAERSLRSITLTRKNFLLSGSKAGADRAAILYRVLEMATLTGLDPEAYWADVIDCMAKGHPINRPGELLRWNGKRQTDKLAPPPIAVTV